MDAVELAERLEGYRVTAVPHGSAALRLVWSAPADAGGGDAGGDAAHGGDGRGAADRGATVLPLLAGYRITRVPLHAAS